MRMKDIQAKQAKAFIKNYEAICAGPGHTLFKGEVIQCGPGQATPQRETRRFTKAEKKAIKKMARSIKFAEQRQ